MSKGQKGVYLKRGEQMAPEQWKKFNKYQIYVNWEGLTTEELHDFDRTDIDLQARVVQVGDSITRVYFFHDNDGFPAMETFIDKVH